MYVRSSFPPSYLSPNVTINVTDLVRTSLVRSGAADLVFGR
jgi:hypothetical protein